MLRRLYLSPLGRLISLLMHLAAPFGRPRMIYGWTDKTTGRFRKHTRISSGAIVDDRQNIAMGDHVWVGHYTVLDGSNGIEIGEGVQIGFWCGIFTHSSHNTIRLMGRRYIETDRGERPGYVRGSVKIGAYASISSGSMILPGVTIGKGALIAGGSLVARDVPDFGIFRDGKIVGDTRRLDAPHMRSPEVCESYFAREDMDEWLAKRAARAA